MMTKIGLRFCLLLLGAVCYVSCYRSPVGGGSYTIPQVGKYPAPTPWNPGSSRGLPPVYHGKFKRSAGYDSPLGDEDVFSFYIPQEVEVQRAKRQDIIPLVYRYTPTPPPEPVLI